MKMKTITKAVNSHIKNAKADMPNKWRRGEYINLNKETVQCRTRKISTIISAGEGLQIIYTG